MSTSHAEVCFAGGCVSVLDLGSRNGVFVNGERVVSQRQLTSGDLVRLGADGPQFEVEFGDAVAKADGGMLATQPSPIAASDEPRPMPDASPGRPQPFPARPVVTGPGWGAVRGTPSVRPFGDQVKPGPALPPLAVPPYPAVGNPAPMPVPQRAASNHAQVPPDLLGKQSIGLNTLMNVVEQTARRERHRTKRVLLPIVATLIVLVCALWYWPKSEPLKWDDHIARTGKSVYVCAVVDSGTPMAQGTAWSLGDGKLATNSHVADLFNNRQRGQVFIVRSSSRPPVDLRIERVTLHPGYERWKELSQRYGPFPCQGFQGSMPAAYDVAILHVHPDDCDNLAPALPIADRLHLPEIRKGDPIALVGYPMENQAGGGVNMLAPDSQARIGTVARSTNYWLANDDSNPLLIGLDLQSAGGASGSPIINSRGEVIAVNSSGNYQFLEVEKVLRRIASGGAYGQRVDVLLDLLEGTAEAMTKQGLEAQFLEQFRKGVEHPDEFASWLARFLKQEGESLGRPSKEIVEIKTPGISGAKTVGSEPASTKVCIRVVVPLTLPIQPVVASLNGGRYEPDTSEYCFLLNRWTLGGETPETRIAVPAGTVIEGSLKYACYWFPVE